MPVNPKDILAIATDLSKYSTEAADLKKNTLRDAINN